MNIQRARNHCDIFFFINFFKLDIKTVISIEELLIPTSTQTAVVVVHGPIDLSISIW